MSNGVLNEVKNTLKTDFEANRGELEGIRENMAQAIYDLEDARKSGDQDKVAAASTQVEDWGTKAQGLTEKLEDARKNFELLDVDYNISMKDVKEGNVSLDELKSLIIDVQTANVDTNIKRTLGEEFGNILEAHGMREFSDIVNAGGVKLVAPMGKGKLDDRFVKDEMMKNLTDTKSLYTNHGTQLVVSSVAVPGFVGYQCGLVEDPYICLLESQPEDFEECLTVRTMPRGNRLRYTRMISRTDNAGVVPESVYNPYPTLVQNGTKPESIFTLATVEVNDTKLAHFVTVSDEVMEDCGNVASLIDNWLVDGLNKKKRQQLISGSGSSGNMRGLLNQPDTLVGTADAGDNIYDTLRKDMTSLYLNQANTANLCVILNPVDLELIDLAKDEFGRYLFNDTDCFMRTLRCLKIRTSVNVPQGTYVIGDFTNNWIFYVRKAIEVRMGYTGDQFITNTNTILAEMRGLTVLMCPQKVLIGTGLGS